MAAQSGKTRCCGLEGRSYREQAICLDKCCHLPCGLQGPLTSSWSTGTRRRNTERRMRYVCRSVVAMTDAVRRFTAARTVMSPMMAPTSSVTTWCEGGGKEVIGNKHKPLHATGTIRVALMCGLDVERQGCARRLSPAASSLGPAPLACDPHQALGAPGGQGWKRKKIEASR